MINAHAPTPAEVQKQSGTTSQANATALEIGRWYMVEWGSCAASDETICLRFGATAPTAVGTDYPRIRKNFPYPFRADNHSQFVAGVGSDESSGTSSAFAFSVYPIEEPVR